jgi:hypothetical protein
MSNTDTYYYIKNAANPQNQCVVAGDQFNGNISLQTHNNRANAKWKFESAELSAAELGRPRAGFYYIVDNQHGCALGTGLSGDHDRSIHHFDKEKKSDWAKYCQWRVQPGKNPGTYIIVSRFSYLSLLPSQANLQAGAPRLSQLESQWVLETAIEGENKPEFVATPEPVLDANFFEDILQGGFDIDVNAASPRRELTAPEAERHRFADKTPWLKQVTRDRSIAAVYQKILRNPSLRYEASGSVIENVVVDNDSPDGVIATPPAQVDADHEYRYFFAYMPSKKAVARLPYTLMGTTPVVESSQDTRGVNLIHLDSPQSSAVKLAAVSPVYCYVLHAKDGTSPAQLCLLDFLQNRVKSIPLRRQLSVDSCEICWIPQEGKLLLAVNDVNQCSFSRYDHLSQEWESRGVIQEVPGKLDIVMVALSASGVHYLLDIQGNLWRGEAGSGLSDLGQQPPPGLWNLKVAPDGGVWGFFNPPDPRQRICVLYEDASGKASWHPVLEPKADGSRTPNGYDDRDKENSRGIACAPISSTQALCWPLAPSKAKRPLYRLSVGAVDQPPLRFPTYTDEEEKKAYKYITDQLLESSGSDLRSRYLRISPSEANNYLTQLQGLTPKPADQISPEKFRAVRDDLACELTYLVFAKNLFNELHLHVLTSQMVNDHAMAVVAKAFDVPTDVKVEAGANNPETSLQGLEISEVAVGGTSGLLGVASAGVGAAALSATAATAATLATAAAVTGIGAAIIGLVAIALAIAAAVVAAEEEKKKGAEQPTFKVTVNDSHYVINSTLAGIQERVDQIFVGILDQFEGWKKLVSQDLGALIVVGRLAKAQVWSTEDLPRVDDPKQPAEIERASRTTLKAYYEACVRTYAKALLRHFVTVALPGRERFDQIFTPRPSNTYPRFPYLGWSVISDALQMHSASLYWDMSRGAYLMQKGEHRDTSGNWQQATPHDVGAPVGADLLYFLIAHGATRDDIASNWNLIINDAMCWDWGHS